MYGEVERVSPCCTASAPSAWIRETRRSAAPRLVTEKTTCPYHARLRSICLKMAAERPLVTRALLTDSHDIVVPQRGEREHPMRLRRPRRVGPPAGTRSGAGGGSGADRFGLHEELAGREHHLAVLELPLVLPGARLEEAGEMFLELAGLHGHHGRADRDPGAASDSSSSKSAGPSVSIPKKRTPSARSRNTDPKPGRRDAELIGQDAQTLPRACRRRHAVRISSRTGTIHNSSMLSPLR